MSSSSSPCAACKLQRRKCTQECIFAPYFPADQPQKFAYIHKVFGASNVAKLLNELNVHQREDAVQSLAYEAETRLRDPVYGCVGLISVLQQRLKMLQTELSNAKKELAVYIGPQALLPMLPAQQVGPSGAIVQPLGAMGVGPSSSSLAVGQYMGAVPLQVHHQPSGALVIREHQAQQQQQVGFDQQTLAAHHEMYRGMMERQRQQQQQDMKFNGPAGFDGIVLGSGYNHSGAGGVSAQAAVSPSLALGGAFDAVNAYQIQQSGHGEPNPNHTGSSSGAGFHPEQSHHQQHNFQPHLSLQPQQQAIAHPQEQADGSGSDERKGCVEGPSC